ncbi:Lrp/AsnC family transcriptional regulator [Tunicatimonas pelagia]|uniref:Lrp/AsnC family transcriptional regulator n=1 Tax=Tunicatimonas pelagia TaxID=931531 RepID=UPI00266556D7|nr:Lrp/AsnC family transcriptional regulator [Tunicatimonas pelagia]WKN40502.1 Lrp/AsnC family transcriptional regulator [Tunicatimonas pelagia]
MSVDQLNQKILERLRKNARIPVSEISKDVGLTAPAIAERIRRMEEAGIIRSYGVVLDYEKLGYALQAFVTVRIYANQSQRLVHFLKQQKEVQACYAVTGREGYYIELRSASLQELEHIIAKLTEFGEPNTSIVLSKVI